MSSNRLVPHQFGPGITADGTRIEQCVRELVALYDDVPPEFVLRRWSPSSLVWGFSPPAIDIGTGTTPATQLPFMGALNNDARAASLFQPPTTFRNLQRVKSCAVPGIDPLTDAQEDLLTWEVTRVASRPCVIAASSLFAEHNGLILPNRGYLNDWDSAAGATTDFTLQCCVSDGWDLENRRKLRQESLLWRMRSDAFAYSASGLMGADDGQPAHPIGNFTGFALTPSPLVLVPAGARVVWQWTVPLYDPTNSTTWGARPDCGNVWSLSGLVFHPTR